MSIKKANMATETMQSSSSTIQNQGLKNDKFTISTIFKTGVPLTKEELLKNINSENAFLNKIIEKSTIDFNTNESDLHAQIVAVIEKTYKNLKNKKNNITDINDEKLYVSVEEKRDDEEDLLSSLFEQHKISSLSILNDLIDASDSLNDRKKNSLKKKISLYPNSISSRSKNALIKFVKKEYKLYQVSGINDTKVKKIMLSEYLNSEYNSLAPRFKQATRTNGSSNEQRLKEFLSPTIKQEIKDQQEYKDLKNILTKRINTKIKHQAGVSLKEFLVSKVQLTETEVKNYFRIEKEINPTLSKVIVRNVSDEELLSELSLNSIEQQLYDHYKNFLDEREIRKEEKHNKIQENKKQKATDEGKTHTVINYEAKHKIDSQYVISNLLTYEKFIFDKESCDFLSKFVNHIIYDMLKSSVNNLIETNQSTNKPKKIVGLDHLKNTNSSLLTILYKNTSTYKQLINNELVFDVSDNSSVKTNEEDADIDDPADESTDNAESHVNQDQKYKKYKTVVNHIKELLNCDSRYSDYKFNKYLIFICSAIVDDFLTKIAESLKSVYNQDFNLSKLSQKKVTLNNVRMVFDIIFINHNVQFPDIDSFYDVLEKRFNEFIREEITT